MPANLADYEGDANQMSRNVFGLTVTNEEERIDAASWLSRVKKLRKQIEDEGLAPVKRLKMEIRNVQAFVEKLIHPLKAGEQYLSQQIGLFTMKEREAAKQLQMEENRRAMKLVQEQTQAHANALKAAEDAGVPPTDLPILPMPDMPEIVDQPTKSVKTDTGATVTVRMLKTFDLGTSIFDGQFVEGVDKSRENKEYTDLPEYLFELNLVKLKAYLKTGRPTPSNIRCYEKSTVAERGA